MTDSAFDYVIVGGDTAGCALAYRLSADARTGLASRAAIFRQQHMRADRDDRREGLRSIPRRCRLTRRRCALCRVYHRREPSGAAVGARAEPAHPQSWQGM